jgi:hypothetical protein
MSQDQQARTTGRTGKLMRREMDTKPESFNGDLAKLPTALLPLTKHPRWVIWKWAQVEKTGKWTKVPYQPDQPGSKASSTDPATWSSYDTALRVYQKGRADGIGYCLLGSNIGAFDLDHCLDSATNTIAPWAQDIVDGAASYTEVTVSGTGLRIIGHAKGAVIHRNQHDAASGLKLETYRNAERYIVVTGAALQGTPQRLADIDHHMDAMVAEIDARKAPKQQVATGDGPSRLPDRLRTLLFVEGSGSFASRSELLFAFLTGAVHARVLDQDIIDACLDHAFEGRGIYEHIQQEGGRAAAVRQLQRAHEMVRHDGGSGSKESIHSWDNPDLSLLDDRRGNLLKFSLGTLKPLKLQEWIKHAAQGTGTTIDHVVVPFLGIASSLIGCGRRVMATKAWVEPMSLWINMIGASGTGKSPGMDATRKPLAKIEFDREAEIAEARRAHDEQVERASAAKARWKNEVKEAEKNGTETPPRPGDASEPRQFVEPRLYTTDVTIERMTALLQARPQGMLLMIDELAGLFKNMSRYSKGDDTQFWLMAWDGRPYIVERMDRAIRLDHLLISIVGGMQPDRLVEVFKGAADGTSARFLYSWPPLPPHRLLSNSIEEADPMIVAMLDRLSRLPKRTPNFIPLTREAIREFEDFRLTTHKKLKTLDSREQEWVAKAPTQVLRLAGTLAYVDWAISDQPEEPDRVKSEYVAAAVELILNYFWSHASAALRQIGLTQKHADARRVLRWIAGNSLAEVSIEVIRETALSRSRDADDTKNMLDGLVTAGWLRSIKQPAGAKGGRPRLRWGGNPRLHEKSPQRR